MEATRKATPGTISAGTLRTDDLLESFARELQHNLQRNPWHTTEEKAEHDRLMSLVTTALNQVGLDDPEGVKPEYVDELIDELQAFAPDGHYFGAHVGDGADFGYWPDDESTCGRHA